MEHLDTLDAEDIALYGDEKVAQQVVSKHRWYTKHLIVFQRDGMRMGFYYLEPASELQEDQDRFEADPVPVFPVTAREVTTTVYEEAAQ
jgi:hypothetical protein